MAQSRYQSGTRWTLRLFLMAAAAVAAGCSSRTIIPTRYDELLASHGIRYRLLTQRGPRPLRIHQLCVDLANPQIELYAALAPDPDGTGPATARLTSPVELAQRAHGLALVNANPWQGLLDEAGKRPTNWHEGMPVQLLGLAATAGRVRCPPGDPKHASFWTDSQGKPRLTAPARDSDVQEGLAGFLKLLEDGRVLHAPGGPIHPRTAMGLDATGRYLYLVVVDGRQPGYSEGMSYCELATYMKGLGCQDAVNLDGGGSSIMLIVDKDGNYSTVNDPSTRKAGASMARPIPAGLVIRSRPDRRGPH